MSSKVSFEGINEAVATFYAAGEVKGGQTVVVSEDATASLCGDGKPFCGVTVAPKREDCVGVQVSGFVTVDCTDVAVTVGHTKLVGDGKGGVKHAESGKEYWVVSKDTDTATILL